MTIHCTNHRSAGFVLVTVLVFTLVATLLSLATLRGIHLAQQQVAQHEKGLREQLMLQNLLVAGNEKIDDAARVLQTACADDTTASALTLRASTLRKGTSQRAMTLIYATDASSPSCTADN